MEFVEGTGAPLAPVSVVSGLAGLRVLAIFAEAFNQVSFNPAVSADSDIGIHISAFSDFKPFLRAECVPFFPFLGVSKTDVFNRGVVIADLGVFDSLDDFLIADGVEGGD